MVAPSSSRVASAGGVSSADATADAGGEDACPASLAASDVDACGVPADDPQPARATLTPTATMNGSRDLERIKKPSLGAPAWAAGNHTAATIAGTSWAPPECGAVCDVECGS
jgi:hypothetical protein